MGMLKGWLRNCALLFLLLLAILLIIGYTYLKDPAVWPIASVKITTELKHIDPGVVQKIVMPFVTKSFFLVQTRALQSELEQLPWAETVSVERVWPDALRIAVIEKKPALRWKESGFISSKAALFYPEEETQIHNLPRLSGEDAYYKEVVNAFIRFDKKLSAADLSIVELDRSPRSAWSLKLSNGLQLYLGQDDIDNRLARFIQVVDTLGLQQPDAMYVDLRYTNGLVLGNRKIIAAPT